MGKCCMEKCCERVLWSSVVEKCCEGVLWRSVVKECSLSLYRAWLVAVSQRRPRQQTLTTFGERAARKYRQMKTV